MDSVVRSRFEGVRELHLTCRKPVLAFLATISLSLASWAQEPPEPAPADGDVPAEEESPPPPEPEDPKLTKAREAFSQGVELVKKANWSGALSAFERSASLHPHATTTFNVGAVERAMGRYTKARATLKRALQEGSRNEGQLAPSLADEARGFIDEIDRMMVRLSVTLSPADAAIAVDGRPLVPEGKEHVAGVAPPGPGKPAPGGQFVVLMSPGAHVLTLSRRGFDDVVVNKTYAPGARETLPLKLERLPARLDISSNVPGAIITVEGRDIGPAPAVVTRAPGSYRVVVSNDGYEDYEATVALRAGERGSLRATLLKEKTAITSRWWFWTIAAAVVAGGAVTTYALTRPEPDPAPYQGGTTGWVVTPQARF